MPSFSEKKSSNLSVFQGFLTAQGAKKNVDIKMYSVVFFCDKSCLWLFGNQSPQPALRLGAPTGFS